MDLSRSAYSRDLKIAAMRALDAGSTGGEIARKYQLSPKLLERWRGEWRARPGRQFVSESSRSTSTPENCAGKVCASSFRSNPFKCWRLC